MGNRTIPEISSEPRYFLTEKVGISANATGVSPRFDAHYGPWESKNEYLAWIRGLIGDDGYNPPSGVEIGVTQPDGTRKDYTWQKPTEGEGYWEPSHPEVGDISGAVYFNSIAAMKASPDLKAGDIAITKGYYSANDGGGSTFRVISSSTYAAKTWKQAISGEETAYLDDATLVRLANGLYADIIVPANMEVSFLQMGARPIYSYSKTVQSSTTIYSVQKDNKPYMMKWLAFCDRRGTTYNLFIPAGAYSFSGTWLLRNNGISSSAGIRIRGESIQYNATATVIVPHYTEQEYIFRIGYKTKGNYTSSAWIPMRNTVINNLCFGTYLDVLNHEGYRMKYPSGIGGTLDPNDDATGYYRYVTKGVLWLDSCPYSQFDGLYFQNVSGTCIRFTQCYESHFGYMNVRQCGRISANGYSYPLFYFNGPGPSDVSACYFYYFNFEQCFGHYFYGAAGLKNFTHCEIGDIQIEGGMIPDRALPIINVINSEPYSTDSDYTAPTFTNAVFGKEYRWYVFAGAIGYMPNIVHSITASTFGHGYNKYRTHRYKNGVATDIDGNTIAEGGYEVVNGICYALNEGGKRIVDVYRYYALVGVDSDVMPLDKAAMAVTFNSVFLNRIDGMKTNTGPWIVYANGNASINRIRIMEQFSRDEYPFYLRNAVKIVNAREQLAVPGAISFIDLLPIEGHTAFAYTRKDTLTPNGLSVLRSTYNQSIGFTLMPNTRYMIRAYVTQSQYDFLNGYQSRSGHAYMKWENVLYIGNTSTPYTGNETVDVLGNGWRYFLLPDLGITTPTKVYLYGNTGISAQFFMHCYLDCIITCGAANNQQQ